MILPLSSIILFDVILGATTPDLSFFRLVLYLLVSACTSSSPKIFSVKLVLIQYRPEFLFYSYSRSDHYSSVFPSSLQVDPRSVKKDPHVMHCFWFFAFFCHSFSLLTPMKMQLHSFSLISLQHLLWWWRWTTMGILYFPFHTCIHFHSLLLFYLWLPTESNVESDGRKLWRELKSMGATTRFFTCIHLSQDNSFFFSTAFTRSVVQNEP